MGRRVLLITPLVMGLAVCAAVAAGAGGAADKPTVPLRLVHTPRGVAGFYVELPHAERSAAWRDNALRADKHGSIPEPSSGYEISNRVVVRTDDPAALRDLGVLLDGVRVHESTSAPGYWVVSLPTVADALDAADVLAADARLAEVYADISHPKVPRDLPTDPAFPLQWHLLNELSPGFDANVAPAWDAGYTGSGVVIGITEGSAWQYDHPDLADNYNADGTQPGGTAGWHATGCAGVAAAAAFNDEGGVGAAYDAQLTGQRYGSYTETAAAFEYRNDINDIKNNSWGPADNGTVTYMSSLERTALENSISTGRGGLGEVFVWAAGNGGTNDRVDYDPYASSRFTCSIGAIGSLDYRAGYNESGSSMLAVSQSSGNGRKIYTTTTNDNYQDNFGGTSASSPLAAGVVALMLQANPDLSWRDVQHVLINSARVCDPGHADWTTNAAGHDINYNYGFGAVDGGAAVALAEGWTPVGPEVGVDSGVVEVNESIPDNNTVGVTRSVEITESIRIESIELILNAQTNFLGDLRIVLIGPEGTESLLATERPDGQDDYEDYIFTSLRHWDERSAGLWSVKISDHRSGDVALWTNFSLRFYGTVITPVIGDLNCDGTVNFFDIDPFVLAISDPPGYVAAYPECDIDAADCNADGTVNLFDVDPFVELLTGG